MTKRILLSATCIAAAFLTVGPAQANETGFEWSVSVLSSSIDDTFSGSRSADLTRVNDSTTGFALAAGWRFNKQVSVELEYADHGTFDGFNVCPPELLCIAANLPDRVDATSISLSVLGEMPVGPQWNLFGRLGYADTSLERQLAGDIDDQSALVGVGLRREISDLASLGLEYRIEAADIKRIGLSLSRSF